MRFIRFPRRGARADLFPAEPKSEAFLTDLAVHGNVAPSTQNQAMNAQKIPVPVVMTRAEVAAGLSLREGTPPLVAKLRYGSGLRIREAVRLRVQDLDSQMKPLTVRAGKGEKDRCTPFPASLTP